MVTPTIFLSSALTTDAGSFYCKHCSEPLTRRGLINNPIPGIFVKELSFVESDDVNGSILSVIWNTGHLLFYHLLYYILCCKLQQNRMVKQITRQFYSIFLPLPELFAHLLQIKYIQDLILKYAYIQHSVSLHRKGNGILSLVRGTCQYISLSLKFAHGSQTYM